MDSKDNIIARAKSSVLSFDQDQAIEVAQEAIKAGISPVEVIQKGYTAGMNEIGTKYEAKQLFLPHVMAAAEAMTAGIDILTPEMEKLGKAEGNGLGTIVIATIEGDIHSIGKDIVAIMLKIAGFDVHNLGRDIPCPEFISAAKKYDAKFVGSSALMTSTMVNQMRIEELLKEEGLKGKVKTIVGGAPVTQEWATKIGADLYGESSSDAVSRLKIAK
ncbi:MAG: dimethylamine corrinoid protein 3 [Methanomassiliicoccus sp.]|nr:dimethylamine corrinoid protein 3 [Methanomassiliicoccus sp.]